MIKLSYRLDGEEGKKMKEIIVKVENAERIMEAFRAEQGRATSRTIDRYSDLEIIIQHIAVRLAGIPKKALEGTTVEYTFAQKFPSAYKYRPLSTHFTLTYKSGTWRISKIGRYTCPNRRGYEYSLHLSDAAKEAVLKLYE